MGSISVTHVGNGVAHIEGAGWAGGEVIEIYSAKEGTAFTSLTAQMGPTFAFNTAAGFLTTGNWAFYGQSTLSGGPSPIVLLTVGTDDPCAAGGLSEAEFREMLTQDRSIQIDGHSFQGPSISEIVEIDKALMAKHARCNSSGNGWGSVGVARAIPPDASGVQDE